MLKIGKTNQYYTLWDVSIRTEYTANREAYQVTSYSYIQNLSMDESRAKEKASQKGCKDLSVDSELYGRNSWETSNKPKWEPEVIAPECFQLGKYMGKNIGDMILEDRKNNPDEWSDFQSYLKWYFTTAIDHVGQLELVGLVPELLKYIQFVTYKKKNKYGESVEYISQKDYDMRILTNKIDDGRIGVFTLSNFSVAENYPDGYFEIRIQPHGFLTSAEEEAFVSEYSYGRKIVIHCPDMGMKMRYYNGYEYWVPAGMRSFKKTIMNLKLNDDDYRSYRITHIVTTGDTGYKKLIQP